MSQNQSNIDVTIQEDHYEDDDDWSDDENDDNDQENLPPSSNIRVSNLDPIKEESRMSYSRYSQHHTDDKDSDEITQRTQAPTPATASNENPRKNKQTSISFGSESFGKQDDFQKVLQEEEEDCHQRNHLRPRPDITSESKVRSWEPTLESLNITRVSERSFSKPFTSTPIAGRNPGPFNAGVSVIEEMSRNFQNESTTLSNTQVNGLIRNIDLDQSSIRNARKFVLQSSHIPKPSKLLDDLKKKRAEKERSLQLNPSSSAKQRQTAVLRKPVLPRVVECDSYPSRPSSSATISSHEIAIKPSPLSNWGFVPIGEEVQTKIYVKNCSSHLLVVTPKLNGQDCFRLASNGAIQIHPNCSQEIIVIFAPTECKRYRRPLHLCVASSGKTYSHNLFGFGGTADVKIVEKRSLAYFPRSGVYRFAPSNASSFAFEVENYGDRSSFVHVVAVDVNGTESRHITVEPQTFCLVPKSDNPNDPSKANITVKVPENYVQEMCRMSMDSVRSTSTVTRNNIFSIKIYFGDERLRQRAKQYCDEVNKHENIQGLALTLTEYHINGHELNANDNYHVSIQDLEVLKSQTRVLTLLVGDDRIEKRVRPSLLPSRPPSSFSHHGRLDNSYYIPEYNNEADSTMLSVAYTDRTRMN